MKEKSIVWINTEIKTPPFSDMARIQAGTLLRRLQYGEILSMPHAKPMQGIGQNCYELRIHDGKNAIDWRIIYHISKHAVVILESFEKKSNQTPKTVIDRCKQRCNRFYRDCMED